MKNKIFFLFIILFTSLQCFAEDNLFIAEHESNEHRLIDKVYYPWRFGIGYKNVTVSDFDSLSGFDFYLDKKFVYFSLRANFTYFAENPDYSYYSSNSIKDYERSFKTLGFAIPIYLYSSLDAHVAIGAGVYNGTYQVDFHGANNPTASLRSKYGNSLQYSVNEAFLEWRYKNYVLTGSYGRTKAQEKFNSVGIIFVTN